MSARADRVERPALHATQAAATSPSPAATDAILDAVREVRDELAELRAAVAPELAQRVALLRSLRCEFGAENFTALDGLERAAERPDGEFARTLVPLLGGSPVGGLRRLSRRLAKLAGKPAGGLVLTCIGRDRGAALYVIQNAHWPVLDSRALRIAAENEGERSTRR